ncbi:MAG: TetR family transcriptional regulator [Alphaproteobacteria bacterium]|nr:TetR family transcriptional regulator [Alphaproteobacteria bacterium]
MENTLGNGRSPSEASAQASQGHGMRRKKTGSATLGRPAGRDGKETRALILSVAARHVAQGGFENLRLHAIAEEAGVTRAAIYHHFASKEDLLVSVYTEGVDNLRQLRRAVLDAPTARDKVLAFIETSKQLQQDDYRYRLAFLGLVEYSRNPEKFKVVREVWDRSVSLLRDAVMELMGVRLASGTADAEQAADVLTSILIGGLTTLSFLRDDPADYAVALDIVEGLVARPNRPPESGPGDGNA